MDQLRMKRAACTIVSCNYLPYARTLCESFIRLHPDAIFCVLLVDRLPSDFDPSQELFRLVVVEDLEIPDFLSVAFKYDILELNTNVKPTFLRMLLREGADEVIYFDPDILVCSHLDPVFNSLSTHSIVLTPHALSPNSKDPQSEVILLSAGVFNLGFIAVKSCPVTDRFLSWWEQRCLNLAYDEQRMGMFVDQKWINLVPCFFNSVAILKDPGCNVAYWNLHERQLSNFRGEWTVNGTSRLVFFHFSGISVEGGDRISKFTDHFDLTNRPDLRELFDYYRSELISHGIRNVAVQRYVFGVFDNGQPINRLTRSQYAANQERFSGENPFNTSSKFYRWAKAHRFLSSTDSVRTYTSKSYSQTDYKARFINTALRVALRILGADRYTIFMKYMSYISILRNQRDLFSS